MLLYSALMLQIKIHMCRNLLLNNYSIGGPQHTCDSNELFAVNSIRTKTGKISGAPLSTTGTTTVTGDISTPHI